MARNPEQIVQQIVQHQLGAQALQLARFQAQIETQQETITTLTAERDRLLQELANQAGSQMAAQDALKGV